jgi:phycocyanobilin lyase beta subunit
MELEGPSFFKDFSRCCEALFKAAADDEWIVRYAAAFGLEQRFGHNSTNTGLKTQAIDHLEQLSSNSEAVKVVQQRAKLALQRLQAE